MACADNTEPQLNGKPNPTFKLSCLGVAEPTPASPAPGPAAPAAAPPVLLCVGLCLGEEPAAQGAAAGQDSGRQVDLQRMVMAVAAWVGRQHPGQLRMHPVGHGDLGRRPGLRLLSRPFQTDLIEGEGKLTLANGGVGLAHERAAQGLRLIALSALGCQSQSWVWRSSPSSMPPH